MRLLHGSNVEVRKPDLKECHSKNDFGRGFYLTPSWNRAWEMGKRRVSIQRKGPLRIFIDRVNQFGSSYTQYCFCTDKAMNELKKI